MKYTKVFMCLSIVLLGIYIFLQKYGFPFRHLIFCSGILMLWLDTIVYVKKDKKKISAFQSTLFASLIITGFLQFLLPAHFYLQAFSGMTAIYLGYYRFYRL